MSLIDQIRERYEQMDPVQRQNFWFAVVGLIVIILLIMSLGDTFRVISDIVGGGQTVAEGTVKDLTNLSNTVKKP